MIDLDALEAKARAATPGPWSWGPSDDYYVQSESLPSSFPHHFKEDASGRYVCWAGNWAPDFGQANAAHIAAFDPPTALALIARIRELEAASSKLIVAWANVFDLPEEMECALSAFEAAAGDLREAARSSKEAADGK